jgi:CheY-like chemotaxis protein
MNILIVEDRDDNADPLSKCILKFVDPSINLLRARNLAEGLEMAKSRQLALCLLDGSLPDSPEPSDTWKSTMEFGCPVIAVSGVSGDADVRKAYDAGVIDFIEKSSPTEVQMEKITRALSRFHQSQFGATSRHMQLQMGNAQPYTHTRIDLFKLVGGICAVVTICGTLVGGILYIANAIGVSAEERATAAASNKQTADNVAKLTGRMEIVEHQNWVSISDRDELHAKVGALEQGIVDFRKEIAEQHLETVASLKAIERDQTRMMIALKLPPPVE